MGPSKADSDSILETGARVRDGLLPGAKDDSEALAQAPRRTTLFFTKTRTAARGGGLRVGKSIDCHDRESGVQFGTKSL